MKKLALMVPSLLLLAACASAPDYGFHPVEYIPAEHLEHAQWGNATLQGTASYLHANGQLVTCANQSVFLLPDTPYFNHLIEGDRQGQYLASPVDPQAQSLVRQAWCNESGEFVLEGLPAGRWWMVFAAPASSAQSAQVLARTVTTRRNQYDEVHLHASDAIYQPSAALQRWLRDQTRRAQQSGARSNSCASPNPPQWCTNYKRNPRQNRHPAWGEQGDK